MFFQKYKVAGSQLYKTSFCFFSRPDEAVNDILMFSRSLDDVILLSQRNPICKKKFDVHERKQYFFTSTIWWSTCLQSFWCEKAIVYSSFGIKILLFGLKKRSSSQRVSPFSGKLIGVPMKSRARLCARRQPKHSRQKTCILSLCEYDLGTCVLSARAPAHASP